jgi:hypothetical protein
MTPLLWFLAGAAFGAFLGVVVMAMLAAASGADDWQEWHDRLGDWEGEGGVYDEDAASIQATIDHIRADMAAEGPPFKFEIGTRVRRGPYDWQQEEL